MPGGEGSPAFGGGNEDAAGGRALELSDCEAGVEVAIRAAGPMSGGGNSRVCRWWRWRRERRLLAPQGQTPLCTSWARLQLRRRLPCLVWLPRYSRTLFFTDVSTGITVGVVLIPQVRANATAAWHGMRTPSPSGAEAGVVCCSPSVGPDHPAQCAGDAIPRRVRKCTPTDRLRLAVGVPAVRVTPCAPRLAWQAIAYALLAELPPTYGLYSSLLPLAVFAPLTSSRHVALGPFALISMLVADSVSEVVDPTRTDEYCQAAVLLSAMVGVVHLLMAAVRAGAQQPMLPQPRLQHPMPRQCRSSHCCNSAAAATAAIASAATASAAGASAALSGTHQRSPSPVRMGRGRRREAKSGRGGRGTGSGGGRLPAEPSHLDLYFISPIRPFPSPWPDLIVSLLLQGFPSRPHPPLPPWPDFIVSLLPQGFASRPHPPLPPWPYLIVSLLPQGFPSRPHPSLSP